jgi:hypothetical protein
MIAQCATSAVLFGAGDIIAQQAVERKQAQHDVRSMLVSRSAPVDLSAQFARTARQTFYGGEARSTCSSPPTLATVQASSLGPSSSSGTTSSTACASPRPGAPSSPRWRSTSSRSHPVRPLPTPLPLAVLTCAARTVLSATFFGAMSALEGETLAQAQERLNQARSPVRPAPARPAPR